MISGEEMHTLIRLMVSVMASNIIVGGLLFKSHWLVKLETIYISAWFYSYIVRLPVYIHVAVNSGMVAIVLWPCGMQAKSICMYKLYVCILDQGVYVM